MAVLSIHQENGSESNRLEGIDRAVTAGRSRGVPDQARVSEDVDRADESTRSSFLRATC